MPYIHKSQRKLVDKLLDKVIGIVVRTYPNPGMLNYCITRLIHKYLYGELSYRSLNEVDGVLDCVKSEFYRQVVAPYEDKKKLENGPVSILDEIGPISYNEQKKFLDKHDQKLKGQ